MTSASPKVLSGSGGTLYLVLTQVASRALTFVGNQFLLRYLSPQLLGLAVQLELLSVTVLYFARESVRVALQRQSMPSNRVMSDRSSTAQQDVNLAYLAVLVGLCISPGLAYGYIRTSAEEVFNATYFGTAFQLYAVATIVELISEPCFAVLQQHALYPARARAETTAAMARCAAACTTVLIMHQRQLPASVLPFAIGQVSYALTLYVMYLIAVLPIARIEEFSIQPLKIRESTHGRAESKYWAGLFSKSASALVVTLYGQSMFKLVLTQGDAWILSFLTDLRSQGAFALASNYGGLLSRLIFQPVEESSRNVFGRLLSSLRDDKRQSDNDTGLGAAPDPSLQKVQQTDSNSEKRGHDYDSSSSSSRKKPHKSKATAKIQTQPTTHSSVSSVLTQLSTTLHLYTLFALPLLALIPPLLPPLINLVMSTQWRNQDTTSILTAYIYYIPFLAINGILDAFVTSAANPAELGHQSLLMACITMLYGTAAWVLMSTTAAAVATRSAIGIGSMAMGSSGLVYANIINMALRICYSVWFINGWLTRKVGSDNGSTLARRLWSEGRPGTGCVVVAMSTALVLRREIGKAPKNMGLTAGSSRHVGILYGLSFEDLVVEMLGAITLGLAILVSEYRFLIRTIMPFVPERLAAKVRPYLPQNTSQAGIT